jgi:hypothetical protein
LYTISTTPQVQQAAKLVRRQQAELSDVQAIISHYAAKVQSPSAKSSSAAAAAAAASGAAAGSASAAAGAAAVNAGAGSSAAGDDVFDDLRPGDYVWVPSFVEPDQLMKVQLLKVRTSQSRLCELHGDKTHSECRGVLQRCCRNDRRDPALYRYISLAGCQQQLLPLRAGDTMAAHADSLAAAAAAGWAGLRVG